jgi:hypothetical protein
MIYYLVPARTETNWFRKKILLADLICFLPRFGFWLDGELGTPATGGMVLAWWGGSRAGEKKESFIAMFRQYGWILEPDKIHRMIETGKLNKIIKRG